MTTTAHDPSVLVTFPDDKRADPYWGQCEYIEIVVRKDILSHHGNLVVAAGRYEAERNLKEDTVTVWSPMHHGGKLPMRCGIANHDWTYPGEATRAIPEHDCWEHLRSGVVSGIYCGFCMADMG